MADPKLILWTSIQWKGWYKAFFTNKVDGVKVAIWYMGWYPLLNYVKYLLNSYSNSTQIALEVLK